MKTRAAVLVQQRQPLELHDLEIPRLQHGQILTQILCSGICGSQLGEIDGVKGPDAYLPHLLGHEACAEVLEVGEGVKRVRVGQRVVLHWRRAPGHEAVPATYHNPRLGKVNSGWVTTFSQYSVVSENRATPVDQETDPAAAALLGCAVTTGAGVVCRNARLELGESILILGAGGVGLSVVQAARLTGGFPISVCDRFQNRLELAKQLGADRVVSSQSEELEALLAVNGGYDVVVESTGYVPFIEMAYRLAASQGRVVLVGVPPAGQAAQLPTLPLHFGKTLVGSHGGDAQPDRDIPRLLGLVAAQRLDLQSLVSGRYPLEDINQAISDMRSGSLAGRCLLDMVVA
ncbi:MAG: zinc-binding dehydrogenase [Candidatus Eremiobacteraeota bacterium]|nr:zinc-binding dehydrogenase [Candidatus Eremiobacteraeota bacterium]